MVELIDEQIFEIQKIDRVEDIVYAIRLHDVDLYMLDDVVHLSMDDFWWSIDDGDRFTMSWFDGVNGRDRERKIDRFTSFVGFETQNNFRPSQKVRIICGSARPLRRTREQVLAESKSFYDRILAVEKKNPTLSRNACMRIIANEMADLHTTSNYLMKKMYDAIRIVEGRDVAYNKNRWQRQKEIEKSKHRSRIGRHAHA